MAGTLVVGAAVIAVIRIARDGRIDGVSVLWIVVAVGATLGVASIEVSAHRVLERAAREARASAGEYIVLFRIGQVTRPGDPTPNMRGKGWINLGERELTITALRGRATLGRYARQDIDSARLIAAPRAYAVLVLTFADGSRFESVPVETGIRNAGLNQERASHIVAAIEKWQQSPAHHWATEQTLPCTRTGAHTGQLSGRVDGLVLEVDKAIQVTPNVEIQ